MLKKANCTPAELSWFYIDALLLYMFTLYLVGRFSSIIINCVRLYCLSAIIIFVVSASLSPGHNTGSCFLSTFFMLFPPFQRPRLRPVLMTTMSPPSGLSLVSTVEIRRNATRETSTF